MLTVETPSQPERRVVPDRRVGDRREGDRRRYNRRQTDADQQTPPYFEVFERIAVALERIADRVTKDQTRLP